MPTLTSSIAFVVGKGNLCVYSNQLIYQQRTTPVGLVYENGLAMLSSLAMCTACTNKSPLVNLSVDWAFEVHWLLTCLPPQEGYSIKVTVNVILWLHWVVFFVV